MGTVLAIAKPPVAPFNPIVPGTEEPVFVVNPGEVITALTGTYVTLVPGRARVDKPVRVTTYTAARSVYAPSEPKTAGDYLSAGDTVYTYSSGEGQHTAWFNGRWFLFDEGTHGRIVERPKFVWWIKVRNARGQVGWTDQFAQFEGIDQLGGPYPDTYAFYRTWRGFDRQPWRDISPGVHSRTIVGATGTLTIVQLDAGATTVSHHHSAVQTSLGLDGTLEMRIGDVGVALGPDVGIVVSADAEHVLANRGTTPATYLELEPIRRFDLLPPWPAPTFPISATTATISAAEIQRIEFGPENTRGGTLPTPGARTRTLGGLTMFDLTPATTGPVTLRSASAAEQFFYCLSGEVRLMSGTQETAISAGEVVLIPRSTAPLQLNKRPAARARVIRFDPAVFAK